MSLEKARSTRHRAVHLERATPSMERIGFHDLVHRAQGGDRKAMDQVLAILRPHLEILARPFADPSRPAESASDLLQESCLRAWQRLDTFEGGKDDDETFAMFRAWVGQIVRRMGLNAQRDRMAKGRSPPEKILPLHGDGGGSSGEGGRAGLPAATQTPSAYVRADETAQRVRAALDRLEDPTAAKIVRMRFFQGLTIPQIAEKIGMSPVRVRERHRSAMRRLRRDLGEWI